MLNSVESLAGVGKEPDIALLQAIARVCLFLNCDAEKVSEALGLSSQPR